jgi:predicted  nucleic acid-binding Zn-ribbon protein
VTLREREGLIGRIRQIRRGAVGPEEPAMASRSVSGQDELRALEDRVAHLEQLVQGLQDSVHRESTRLEKRLTDVETRIEPGAMGRALSDDARERGL